MPLPKTIPRPTSAKSKSERRILANRYAVEKKLGKGNYGTAWLVTDLKCKEEKEKKKVVKEIAVGDLQPDETIDAMHEANLLKNLDHPGIVRFHDSFIESDNFCIVTEYCEGGDLDQKIAEYKKKGKSIPAAQVVEWIIQLLLAVQFIHERRVLHRDLKARNIFLKHNMIKIGDFGISRILMGTTDMASTFVGTPYYMSPEVLKHEGYNAKSDVWSVGCILYELVALKHAFEGQSLMGVMYQIVEGELPAWPQEYPQELRQVFNTILTKSPAERPSAGAVLKLAFLAKQMELLTNTMMDRHSSKREKAHQDSQHLAQAMKENKSIDQLKKESEEKKWKNLAPRERYRIRKMEKADEEARKLREAAEHQVKANRAKYDELRTTMSPYQSHVNLPAWSAQGAEGSRRRSTGGVTQQERPFTTPDRPVVLGGGLREEDEREGADGDSDQEEDTFHTAKEPVRFTRSLEIPRGGRQPRPHLAAALDERPITPMKDTMVYDIKNSSLDFKDGIPENPDLANTYYSQFEEFERLSSDSDGDEGTLVATSGNPEMNNLLSLMRDQLDHGNSAEDTVAGQTLVEDRDSGAFGPAARDSRILKLRSESEKKFGAENFARVYSYLKTARGFSERSVRTVDESVIMRELKKIVKNVNDCFLVDQLLFLESQAEIPS